MRKIIQILLILLSTFGIVFGQEKIDQSKKGNKAIIGFTTGPLFSALINNKSENNSPYDFNISNKKYKLGFSAGCFISFINKKHFSLQTELMYILTCQDLNYHITYNTYNHWGNYNEDYADYTLSLSRLQFSMMPTFQIGKKYKTYMSVGPFIELTHFFKKINGSLDCYGASTTFVFINDTIGTVPVTKDFHYLLKDNDIKVDTDPQNGWFVSLGEIIPFKKNIFGVEFRFYYTSKDFIPFLRLKQNYFTFNLKYQLKTK